MAGVNQYLIPQVQPNAPTSEQLLGRGFNVPLGPGPKAPPLQLSLPQNQRSLALNLGSPQLAPFFAAYPKAVAPYKALQTQRVNILGTTPYTIPEAKHAIQAAGTEKPVTPAPTRTRIYDIPGNVSTDVTELVHSLNPVTLAQGIASQVAKAGHIPEEIGRATQQAQGNPIQLLGNLAHVPGFNLIPGSFIASQFGTNQPGFGGLVQHPLYTALDLIPYLNKAAEASNVVKAARTAVEERNVLARAAGITPESTRIRPISTFIRNFQPGAEGGVQLGEKALGTAGEVAPGTQNIVGPALEPNVIGRTIQAAREAGATTPLGGYISKTFGAEARAEAKRANRVTSAMMNRPVSKARSPEEATLLQAAADSKAVTQKYLSPKSPDFIPVAEREAATLLAKSRGIDSPEWAALPENVRTWGEAHIPVANALAEFDVAQGNLVKVPFKHGEEIYDKATGARILAARDRAAANTQAIHDFYTASGSYAEDEIAQARAAENANNPAVQQALADIPAAMAEHDYARARAAVQVLQNESPFAPLPFTIAKRELKRAASPAAGLAFPRQAVPATVIPRMAEEVKAKLAEALTNPEAIRQPLLADFRALAPEAQSALLAEAARGQYANIIDPLQLTKLENDVAKSWITLREGGFNPVFHHGVSPRQAAQAPAVLDYNPSLTSLKQKAWNPAAGINDLSISLDHLAYEHLQKHFIENEYLPGVMADKAVNGKVLQARLNPQMDAYMADHPGLNAQAAMDQLISRAGYAPFNPNTYLNITNKATFLAPAEQLYLPKAAVAVLDELKNPKVGGLGALMQKPMKLFRASVLTLRPQWYLGNAVSGAILTAGQAPNLASALKMVKYMPDAWALARRPMEDRLVTSLKFPENINFADKYWDQMAPRDVVQQSHTEFLADIKPTPQAAATLVRQFKGGEKYMQIYSDMKKSFPAGKVGVFDKVATAGGVFNSTFDNFWSNVSLIADLDDQVSKMTKTLGRKPTADELQAARDHAIETSRRTFETWDTLTPGERGIVKSIFPFYGFTRSMLKYVLQYPANHPTRLSILAHLAHAEQEDMDSGLPEQLRALSYFGDVQPDGSTKAFGIGGLNPFQDIGSYASLLGFMTGGQGDLSAITRNVNPALSTALDALGVDPSRGAGQLYPELYFDPATGKMATKTGNLLSQFATNIVPQSEILMDITGANADFNNMLRTNPDGAGRQLLSSVGFPMFFKKVNLPQERMKAEVARFKQQKLDLAAALKEGNIEVAERWPGLRMALDTLAKMPEAERKKYQLQTAPSAQATLPSAIRSALPV